MKLIDVDYDKKRISLSMKQVPEDYKPEDEEEAAPAEAEEAPSEETAEDAE